jgi:hypothetical protein
MGRLLHGIEKPGLVPERLSGLGRLFDFARNDVRTHAWNFGSSTKPPVGNTSKGLDKNVVVRVILHGQCSLQRKEAK